MNKEKALKNQGLEFREDISSGGGISSGVAARGGADQSDHGDFREVDCVLGDSDLCSGCA